MVVDISAATENTTIRSLVVLALEYCCEFVRMSEPATSLNRTNGRKAGQVAVKKGADVDHLEKNCVSKI